MLWLLWQICLWAGIALLLLVAYLSFLFFRKQARLRTYEAQGVFMPPGWDRFPVGHVKEFGEWDELRKKLKFAGADVAQNVFIACLHDWSTESKAPNSFDYGKHQVSMFDAVEPYILISDPDIVQELFTTKQQQHDKTGKYLGALSNFFGETFLFQKANDSWKAKRRGLGHAFYKDKLVVLLDTLKDYMLKECDQWTAELRAPSSDGVVKVDMATKFQSVIQQFLLHAMLGSNLKNVKVTVQVQTEPNGPFKEREHILSEAIDIVFDQVFMVAPARLFNPFWLAAHALTGKCHAMSEAERVADANSAIVREALRTYIRKRVSGEAKSEVAGNSDIMSLMLENKDVFTEDDVIDEILDLMVAGTITTQLATQTCLGHLMTEPESMKRLRAEFAELDGVKEAKDTRAALQQLTLDNCYDQTYLGYVMQEALRMMPPAAVSSFFAFEKDTVLAKKLRVKAGENLFVYFWGLHYNSTQWQRPYEFLPDRFDASHPLARKPDGGKRSAYAWAPFNGGRRICFGKTFAEQVIKVLVTVMSQSYDMNFVDPQWCKGNLPMKVAQQTHYPPIWIELRERKD